DVVQAMPVLRLLKRRLPASEIYWWVQSTFAPLLEGDPDLAGVLRFERRGWSEPRRWPVFWRSIQGLRAPASGWVIDLQRLARSAFRQLHPPPVRNASGTSIRDSRRPGRSVPRPKHRPSRSQTLPRSDRPTFTVGTGGMDPPGRGDGHQRYRADAHRRRAQ